MISEYLRLLCVSRLQAENYLAADLRAEPGYPTSLSQYLGHY